MYSLFFLWLGVEEDGFYHPVKNSLNFRHPSEGGEFLRLQLRYWLELHFFMVKEGWIPTE